MKLSFFFGLAVALTAMCGCRELNVASEPGTTPELPSEAPLVADAPGDSPGKPSPPIGIRYELLGDPAVGQPLEIRITARSNVSVLSLTTRISGDEGLYVAPASSNFAVPQMLVDEPAIRTLTVTPLREGLLQLAVRVQGEIDGRIQANNVTIPIQVGVVQESREPMGTRTTDETGEAIISLPAQEN